MYVRCLSVIHQPTSVRQQITVNISVKFVLYSIVYIHYYYKNRLKTSPSPASTRRIPQHYLKKTATNHVCFKRTSLGKYLFCYIFIRYLFLLRQQVHYRRFSYSHCSYIEELQTMQTVKEILVKFLNFNSTTSYLELIV